MVVFVQIYSLSCCVLLPPFFFIKIIWCKALPHPSSEQPQQVNTGQSSKKTPMSSSPIAPAVVSATNDLLDQVVKATTASRRQALRQKLLPVDEVVKATEQESTAAAVTFDEFEFSPEAIEEFELLVAAEEAAVTDDASILGVKRARDEPAAEPAVTDDASILGVKRARVEEAAVTDDASILGAKRAREEPAAVTDDASILGVKRAREESVSDSDSDSDSGSDSGSDSAAAPNLAGASAIDIMSMLTPEQLAAISAQLVPKTDGVKSNMGTAKKYRRPKKLDVIHNNFVRAKKHLPKFKKSGNYLLPEASIKWLPKWANDNLEKISDYKKQEIAAAAGKGVKAKDIADDDISIDEHEDVVIELKAELAAYHKAMEIANKARNKIATIIGDWESDCKYL